MFHNVLQAFLRDAVQRDFDVIGQSRVGQVHRDIDLADRAGQTGQTTCQTEIIEHRWSQTADRSAGLLQRQIDQFPCHAELFGHHCGVGSRGARGRVEPIGQRDQPLRNAVVDIARQPATFELLGLDDLFDEVLVCPFADHQLAVKARLVHGTGDQLPDHQQ